MLSCESDSKEVDALFYQMSADDSAMCMNEILDGIQKEALEWQIGREMALSEITWPICFPPDNFRIMINSSGSIMLELKESREVTEKVFEFFIFNRNLKNAEVASMDVNHAGFHFPFYHLSTYKEIERMISENKKQLQEMKSDTSSHHWKQLLQEDVAHLELELKALKLLGVNSLPQLPRGTNVKLSYQKEGKLLEDVKNQIALAFYHLRNYECLRYFDETYLNLYERAQRKNRELDFDKLQTLEILHQATIIINNQDFRQKHGLVYKEAEPPVLVER